MESLGIETGGKQPSILLSSLFVIVLNCIIRNREDGTENPKEKGTKNVLPTILTTYPGATIERKRWNNANINGINRA